MINLRRVFFLLPLVFLAFSCDDDVNDIVDDDNDDDDNSVNVVQMTVGNTGASSYFVSNITGNEEVTTLNADNSSWELTVGTRYVITVTGASAHPFALRDSDNALLLTMNSATGTFESDADVDFEADDSTIRFTLTQELADQLDNYVCTLHASMTGSVTVK
jgi:plastocyanin